MQCIEVQQKLSDYIDGSLPEDQQQQLEEHLQNCSDCRRAAGQMKMVVTELNNLTEVEPPKDLISRVTGSFSRRTVSFLRRRVIAACIALLVIFTGNFYLLTNTTAADMKNTGGADAYVCQESAAENEIAVDSDAAVQNGETSSNVSNNTRRLYFNLAAIPAAVLIIYLLGKKRGESDYE